MARGLQWVTSNRLEFLAQRLAAAVRSGLTNPLAPETIVVQSLGMARWLQLELARLNGLCSHIRFPFPQAFLREISHQLVPEAAVDERFTREVLTWRIWSIWGSAPPADFAETRHYFGTDPRRRFQLASRVAGLFDQYLVYRPAWLELWRTEPDPSWQASLWRSLDPEGTGWPESRLLSTAVQRLQQGRTVGLPQRVSVFGISALPPAYLQFLASLADPVEVTLYQLQPCREYWGDTVSRREEQRALRRVGRRPDEGPELNFARGHRLLSSLGRLGRSFQDQLAELGGGAEEAEAGIFSDPGTDSLLHTLQSDLLNLVDREGGEELVLRPDDASLRLHSCHSPRRELEVLYDQILEAIEVNPALAPRDILVLIPDIESYAPLIQAVFGTPEEERRRLPFTVADRVPRAESPLADRFLHLLQLPGSRFGRSEVVPLLELGAVQRRFGLRPADLPRIREWLEQLNQSWGLDAGQRGQQGFPALPQGTWRHAADRLLLGYALAPGDEVVLDCLSPFPGIEGDEAARAGRLAAFVAALEQLGRDLEADRPLEQWADDLGAVLTQFFAADEGEEAELQLVRDTLARLRQVGLSAALTEPTPLAAIVEQLAPWLSEERRAGGFLRGGITFAALKPMRSVPARFIAILGLNDGEFPRRTVPLSFDLLAAHPEPGDEAREADDRYLFLETLLSARERLHLSYVGRSLRDNADLPPSVVVGELLDHLGAVSRGGAAEVNRRVVIRHPLQAFSPDYFGGSSDPRLFSFSRENSAAAEVTHRWTAPRPPGLPFGAQGLPPEIPTGQPVKLDDLLTFLINPSRAFLQQRLGVRLPEAAEVPDDRELFEMDSLSAYALKEEWIDRLRRGESTTHFRERLLADGRLPLGPTGPLQAQRLELGVRRQLARLAPGEWEALPPIPVNLDLDGFRLSGSLGHQTAAGLCRVRPAKFKPSHLLQLWLELLVHSLQSNGAPSTARLVAEDDSWTLMAPGNPKAVLVELLKLHAKGLGRPLPFFPLSAWAFVSSKDGLADSRIRALKEWQGNQQKPGESAEVSFAFCFGAVTPHPLDAEFETLADEVMKPVASAARKDPSKS